LPTTISHGLGAARNLTAIGRHFPANSCSLLMVITQEPTQPLATLHRLIPTSFRNPTKQQNVGLSLMIPLGVVVLHVFAQRPPQRALAKENDLGQTLLLHRSHPALRIGVLQSSQLHLFRGMGHRPSRLRMYSIRFTGMNSR